MTNAPEVLQSERFERSYASASVIVQTLVQGAVHDFVRRYRADKRQVARNYQRLRGIHSGRVLEIDVAGGLRCVAAWEAPALTLLDVGSHEIVPRYREAWLDKDVASATEVPPTFLPDSTASLRFFSRNPSTGYEIYGNELSSEWLYFLDVDQVAAYEKLLNSYIDSLESEVVEPRVFFVIDGPRDRKDEHPASVAEGFR